MVFLPEACDYIGENSAETVKNAEAEDGPLISNYKQLALEHNIWLSLGGIHIKVLPVYWYVSQGPLALVSNFSF